MSAAVTALSPIRFGPRPIQNQTTSSESPDDIELCDPGKPNAYGSIRARAHILTRYGDAPRPSFAQLQSELGLATKSAVVHHVDRLVGEGLLSRLPGNQAPVLTPAGRTCATYLRAVETGEPSFRRLVRKAFGSYSRKAVQAVKAAAEEMDRAYSLDRQNLRRNIGGVKELERKVTARDILQALRSSSTIAEAARQCGIQAGALDARIATLLKRAQRMVPL